MAKNKGTAERAVLTVRETADVLGIGMNQTYEAIRAGQIPNIRINEKRILVPRVALKKMLAGAEAKGDARRGPRALAWDPRSTCAAA